MTRIEAIRQMAQIILNNDDKVLGTDEYNELVAQAESREEIDLYTELYNYLLKKKQQTIVKNNIF